MRRPLLFTLFVGSLLFLATPRIAHGRCIIPNTGEVVECNPHSIIGTQFAWFTVANPSPRTVLVYWLDYQGREIFYRQLGPGQVYLQRTYVTHPWRVRDANSGRVVAFVTITKLAHLMIIR